MGDTSITEAEKQIAEQMADLLRTRINEMEALKTTRTAAKCGGARLALLRRLLAELESRSCGKRDVGFRDWNSWRKRFPG